MGCLGRQIRLRKNFVLCGEIGWMRVILDFFFAVLRGSPAQCEELTGMQVNAVKENKIKLHEYSTHNTSGFFLSNSLI